MPIADLGSVLLKLDLDGTNDPTVLRALEEVTAGANAWVARRTRFADAAGPFADVLRNVRDGGLVTLSRRPVSALTAVEGRLSAASPVDASAWSPLSGDLVDPDGGVLRVFGPLPQGQIGWAAEAYPVLGYPGSVAPWYRWRNRSWPVVRVTYAVAEAAVPDDVRDATAALAVYWWYRHLAGAAQQVGVVGQASSTLLSFDVPPWIETVLAPYSRSAGGVVAAT